MPKIVDLFTIHCAKSRGINNLDSGDIPFVSNGFSNNGVVGFVTPSKYDKTFEFMGICVSAFCEATVQDPPFMPRGNGGSGLIVLQPKANMDRGELLYYASYINKTYRWRFSFGRMVTKSRFENLAIAPYLKYRNIGKIGNLIPKDETKGSLICHNRNFTLFNITELFNLHRGDFHALNRLDPGDYPTVSRICYNNGIVGYYDKPLRAKVYPAFFITVSSVTGDAFVQLEDFISTDNVVICEPKIDLKITTLFFIQFLLNSVKWRWSYGRQCYKTKFATTNIHLPIINGNKIDEDYIATLIKSTPYWNIIDNFIRSRS